MSGVESLIEAAKRWRGLSRLEVAVRQADGNVAAPVAVALGESRRRWKRVAATLEGMALAWARGLDKKGELLGIWEPGEQDDEVDEELDDSEGDFERGHRKHTQWCITEVARIFGETTRLNTELVRAVIELIRRAPFTSSGGGAPAGGTGADDDGTQVLKMLLMNAMQGGSHAREDVAASGGSRGDGDGQGQQEQSDQAGT